MCPLCRVGSLRNAPHRNGFEGFRQRFQTRQSLQPCSPTNPKTANPQKDCPQVFWRRILRCRKILYRDFEKALDSREKGKKGKGLFPFLRNHADSLMSKLWKTGDFYPVLGMSILLCNEFSQFLLLYCFLKIFILPASL